MTQQFTIEKATRQGIRPLIGLFGLTGGGKTKTALLIARGLVGDKGKIVGIDTESGRMRLFAEEIPNGYDIVNLDAPFSPENYLAAVKFAESQGADVIVLDSMSHEHEGEGGVLQTAEAFLDKKAGDDYRKREALRAAAWNVAKAPHKLFVNHLLRVKCPLICCFRAKTKLHIIKKEGKTEFVTGEFPEPIYDASFWFETLVCAEVYNEGRLRLFGENTKVTLSELRNCLPKENEQAGIKHGQLIAAWANRPNGKPADSLVTKPDESLKIALKKRIWDACKSKLSGVKKDQQLCALNDALKVEGIIDELDDISVFTIPQLQHVASAVETAFSEAGK